MRYLLTALLVCLGTLLSLAQNPAPYKEERSVLYKNEFTGGVFIHSTSWGIQARRAFHVTGDKKLFFEADLTTLKHPKEYSLTSLLDNGESYVFGKRRSFILIRTGVGYQQVIFDKGERSGVQIRYLYGGGIDWGFTKLIYYTVADNRNMDNIISVPFNSDLSQYNIYGTDSYFKGFDALAFHPGVYGKAGFSFEYSSNYQTVTALEIGTTIDLFAQQIPIMAAVSNPRLFLGFYLEFLYGRKW